MPKRLMLVVAVAFVVVSAVGTAIAVGQSSGSNNVLVAHLSGRNENPGADPNGRGGAAVVLTGSRVCLSMSYSGLSKVVAAHIHHAPKGKNGPIVVDPKFTTGGPAIRGTLGRCVTPNAGTSVSDIRNHPSDYYVNIHSTQFPAGAIRGQLRRG
jgi:hypothetical protein